MVGAADDQQHCHPGSLQRPAIDNESCPVLSGTQRDLSGPVRVRVLDGLDRLNWPTGQLTNWHWQHRIPGLVRRQCQPLGQDGSPRSSILSKAAFTFFKRSAGN